MSYKAYYLIKISFKFYFVEQENMVKYTQNNARLSY